MIINFPILIQNICNIVSLFHTQKFLSWLKPIFEKEHSSQVHNIKKIIWQYSLTTCNNTINRGRGINFCMRKWLAKFQKLCSKIGKKIFIWPSVFIFEIFHPRIASVFWRVFFRRLFLLKITMHFNRHRSIGKFLRNRQQH